MENKWQGRKIISNSLKKLLSEYTLKHLREERLYSSGRFTGSERSQKNQYSAKQSNRFSN